MNAEEIVPGMVILLIVMIFFFGLDRTKQNKEMLLSNMVLVVKKAVPQDYPYTTMPTSIYFLSDTAFIERTGLFQVGDTLLFDADYQQFKKR